MREKVKQLQNDIDNLIMQFEEDSEMSVQNISLTKYQKPEFNSILMYDTHCKITVSADE